MEYRGLAQRYRDQGWTSLVLIILAGFLAVYAGWSFPSMLLGVGLGHVFWPWFFWTIIDRPIERRKDEE